MHSKGNNINYVPPLYFATLFRYISVALSCEVAMILQDMVREIAQDLILWLIWK